jgi:hypothetical protein
MTFDHVVDAPRTSASRFEGTTMTTESWNWAMRHKVDRQYVEAMERLLARPDPLDLRGRGNVLRWDGHPDRRTTHLPAILTGWLQRRFLEIDPEEPIPSATVVNGNAGRVNRVPRGGTPTSARI